ncbi:MAG: c-type cytochrome, partial [Planctomycetota bacterium]|nr:c-type cytochrome [Planctomycetota bacterium]
MFRINIRAGQMVPIMIICCCSNVAAQDDDKAVLARYRAAAAKSGDPTRGKTVFESQQSGCTKCHAVSGKQRKAGPDLAVIGDKFTRDQMIRAVLEPSAAIHPDFATINITTTEGKVINGVLQKRTDSALELLDAEARLVRIASNEIED